MKFYKLLLTLVLSGIISYSIAQELPKVSPRGNVQQTVGLTHITLDYSRPSVKDREIVGKLLPYGQVWRLGANSATTITNDEYLKFGDQLLKPGTYSMFAIPDEKTWKVVFNSNPEQWGTSKYDEKLNVVTLDVKPESDQFTETLEIGIEDITMNSGVLTIRWEKTTLKMPFKVNTNEIANKNIKEAIEKGNDLGNVYYNAAKYMLSIEDHERATEYISKSISLETNFKNLFLQAKILVAQGDKKLAIKKADEAHKLAMDAKEEGWASYIKENIDEWKK